MVMCRFPISSMRLLAMNWLMRSCCSSACMIPHVLDGLKAAAGSEHFEADDQYPAFAKVAREEGFDELGEFFDNLAAIEATHEERYNVLTERIKNDEVFRREEAQVWYCTVCGHLHIGKEAPEKCPVCAHPQSHFEIRATNY